MKNLLCAFATLFLLLAQCYSVTAGETAKQKQPSSQRIHQATQEDRQKQTKENVKKQTPADKGVERDTLHAMTGTKKPKDQQQDTQPQQKKKEPKLTEKEKKQLKELEKKMKDQKAQNEMVGNIQKSTHDSQKSVTRNIR